MNIREVVSIAKRELLPIDGVVAVSHEDNYLIVYVETEDVIRRLPSTFYGYPVQFKVIGRITIR